MTIKNDKLILQQGEVMDWEQTVMKSSKDRRTEAPCIRPDTGVNGVRSVNVTSDERFLIITFESSLPRIRVVDLEKLEYLPHSFSGHTASVRITSLLPIAGSFILLRGMAHQGGLR